MLPADGYRAPFPEFTKENFLSMSVVDQCDAAMFAAYLLLLKIVMLAGLHTMEKGDAKLCDDFSQASAGDMQLRARAWS